MEKPKMRWCDCCGQPIDEDFASPLELAGLRLEGNTLFYGKSNTKVYGGERVLLRWLMLRGRISHEAFEAIKETEALDTQTNVYACRLRRAFERLNLPLKLKTHYGWGYQLVDSQGEPVVLMDKVSRIAGAGDAHVDTIARHLSDGHMRGSATR